VQAVRALILSLMQILALLIAQVVVKFGFLLLHQDKMLNCGDDGTSDVSNDIFENRGSGNSACVEAQVVSHNNISSSQRYLVYNGEIYYCRQAGETSSPYSFVTGINPGSSIGSWKCGFDGKWRGGSVIGIRGGRIKIVA